MVAAGVPKNVLTTFDPDKHPEDKKVIIEGEEFCEDVFDAFVKKGDSVGTEMARTEVTKYLTQYLKF